MLEILRVLSRQEHVNRHTILFLFNGAEETPLQASHGFVSQHPWAKNVKGFIYLFFFLIKILTFCIKLQLFLILNLLGLVEKKFYFKPVLKIHG